MKTIRNLFLLVLIAFSVAVTANPIYDACDILVEELGEDFEEVSQVLNRSIITSVTVSENIDESARTYILKRIESISKKQGGFHLAHCKSCFTARAEVDGEDIIIKKGVLTEAELKKIATMYRSSSYSEIDLVYAGKRLILNINIYQIEDGKVRWAKSYSTRLLNLTKLGLVTRLSVNQSIITSEEGSPLGGTATLGERIYGLGDISLYGTFLGGSGKIESYTSFGLLLNLNMNEISKSFWNWGSISLPIKVGFGWYGGTRDLTIGAGTQLYIGSMYHVSLEYLVGLNAFNEGDQPGHPTSQNKEDDGFPGAALVGLGISF